MELAKVTQWLIYIHALFGGIALFSGGIALVVKKGKTAHKKSGKVFYYTMLTSAIMALIISLLPNHKNPFLFCIGMFSSYFLLSGYRSLNYNKATFDLTLDKIIAYFILLTGISMIIYSIIINNKLNIVLLIFGVIGLVFGTKDLISFRDLEQLKKNWLKYHLGKMMGGYIAAVSAFMVVNQLLPGIWNWFAPAIVGNIYIIYWTRKLKKNLTKHP